MVISPIDKKPTMGCTRTPSITLLSQTIGYLWLATVKYRGPILRVTWPVLGSNDLSIGMSIQILPEPNAGHMTQIFFIIKLRLYLEAAWWWWWWWWWWLWLGAAVSAECRWPPWGELLFVPSRLTSDEVDEVATLLLVNEEPSLVK